MSWTGTKKKEITGQGGFTLILVGVGGQTIGQLVEQWKAMLINLRVYWTAFLHWSVHFLSQLLLKKCTKRPKIIPKISGTEKRDTFSSFFLAFVWESSSLWCAHISLQYTFSSSADMVIILSIISLALSPNLTAICLTTEIMYIVDTLSALTRSLCLP